jgi:hypothetical protein
MRLNKKKRSWIGITVVVLVISIFLFDTFRQPGLKDLPGQFEQMAFVRNEQNKGGIIRIYAIKVIDVENADYEACMERLPHNAYGSSTTAYFFDAKGPIPTNLHLAAPHFDSQHFHPIAAFTKDEKGQIVPVALR